MNITMNRIVFATNNKHKLSEIRQMVGNSVEVLSLDDINCHEDIPETADTLEGNAVQKAEYIFRHYGIDCFADDTGLEVEALNGEPGVYSARYAAVKNPHAESHDAEANMDTLLDNLKGEENRKARFRTVICLIVGGQQQLFEGIVEGEIIKERRGGEGFGYDPIFQPLGYDKTFAELGNDIKNAISHRAKAVKALVDTLIKFH